MFQSSPAPRSRCCSVQRFTLRGVGNVSILTGSKEPVLPNKLRIEVLFQNVSILTGSKEPVLLLIFRSESVSGAVSILTGSKEPVLRKDGRWIVVVDDVSILTGSKEPVLRSIHEEIGPCRDSDLTGVELRRCRFPRRTGREPRA